MQFRKKFRSDNNFDLGVHSHYLLEIVAVKYLHCSVSWDLQYAGAIYI